MGERLLARKLSLEGRCGPWKFLLRVVLDVENRLSDFVRVNLVSSSLKLLFDPGGSSQFLSDPLQGHGGEASFPSLLSPIVVCIVHTTSFGTHLLKKGPFLLLEVTTFSAKFLMF